MREYEDAEILSTLPAPGWFARLKCYDDPDNDETYETPLVCWAVVNVNGNHEITGMMATDEVDYAEEHAGFMCYIHTSELKTEWQRWSVEDQAKLLKYLRSLDELPKKDADSDFKEQG